MGKKRAKGKGKQKVTVQVDQSVTCNENEPTHKEPSLPEGDWQIEVASNEIQHQVKPILDDWRLLHTQNADDAKNYLCRVVAGGHHEARKFAMVRYQSLSSDIPHLCVLHLDDEANGQLMARPLGAVKHEATLKALSVDEATHFPILRHIQYTDEIVWIFLLINDALNAPETIKFWKNFIGLDDDVMTRAVDRFIADVSKGTNEALEEALELGRLIAKTVIHQLNTKMDLSQDASPSRKIFVTQQEIDNWREQHCGWYLDFSLLEHMDDAHAQAFLREINDSIETEYLNAGWHPMAPVPVAADSSSHSPEQGPNVMQSSESSSSGGDRNSKVKTPQEQSPEAGTRSDVPMMLDGTDERETDPGDQFRPPEDLRSTDAQRGGHSGAQFQTIHPSFNQPPANRPFPSRSYIPPTIRDHMLPSALDGEPRYVPYTHPPPASVAGNVQRVASGTGLQCFGPMVRDPAQVCYVVELPLPIKLIHRPVLWRWSASFPWSNTEEHSCIDLRLEPPEVPGSVNCFCAACCESREDYKTRLIQTLRAPGGPATSISWPWWTAYLCDWHRSSIPLNRVFAWLPLDILIPTTDPSREADRHCNMIECLASGLERDMQRMGFPERVWSTADARGQQERWVSWHFDGHQEFCDRMMAMYARYGPHWMARAKITRVFLVNGIWMQE